MTISGPAYQGNSSSDPVGNVANNNYTVTASNMGRHSANSVILGAYYAISRGNAAVYFGGGLGLTRSNVSDALSDGHTVQQDFKLSQHISAGIDRQVANKVLIGLKLTYSRFADAMQTGDHMLSPETRSAETITFKEISDVSLAVSAKYLFRWKPLHIKR